MKPEKNSAKVLETVRGAAAGGSHIRPAGRTAAGLRTPACPTARSRPHRLAGCLDLLLLVSMLAGWGNLCRAQIATQREYELKAGVLYNIIAYVEWPAAALSNQPPEIQIGLLGQIPFANALHVLDGKVIQGRKLVVKELLDVAQASTCHVLFIAASEKARFGEIIEHVRERPVLTVSEVEGFAERGGMVNLLTGPNRIIMEINRNTASQSQLGLSSQLLKLARVVSRQG